MRISIYPSIVLIFIIAGCKKNKDAKSTGPSRDFQAAEYYDYYQVNDSAFYFYNRVIDNSRDSLERGIAYFKMGLRQLEVGDYYSAQESLLSSIKALDDQNEDQYQNISSAYNTLANATLDLKDYESAIRNYRLAWKFAPDGDPKLYILNNLGVAYQKKADYEKAIAVFDSASSGNTLDTALKARIISNFARTKWLADPHYVALPEFISSLRLRELIKDSLGMNASFAHLSDYYARSRLDSAFFYASKRLQIALTLDDPYDRLEALNQLAKVSPPQQTKLFLEEYLKLDDSLSSARSRDRNQYVLIKFDAEKSKADNLLLQKHIVRQRLILWGTVLIAALLITALIVSARVRRKRLKREAENEIRESKLRTSQKVHDVVANGLYRIMNELEHREAIDKEPLINKIEILYEKSRDISYEEIAGVNPGVAQQIHELLSSFAHESAKVIVAGNEATFWNKITPGQKHEIQMVLEELMVNMQKHSRAKNVLVTFRLENQAGSIYYKDDGVGFRAGVSFGNGLNNTVNRIKTMNGEINFGKNGEKGLSISITFPLESL